MESNSIEHGIEFDGTVSTHLPQKIFCSPASSGRIPISSASASASAFNNVQQTPQLEQSTDSSNFENFMDSNIIYDPEVKEFDYYKSLKEIQ